MGGRELISMPLTLRLCQQYGYLKSDRLNSVQSELLRNHEETEEEEENREQRKLESSYRESKLLQGNIKVTFGPCL
ncbi:hypothetical protein PIB30_062464 [Stylosanthes scabra]|uniref:Uncharacterized protein n=1 Tax=Stylosanthes scabra TaxID=79078 RepID=A0ABU6WKY4_9FABA|nr:hypothetical protein [Stylosanthes scabra]